MAARTSATPKKTTSPKKTTTARKAKSRAAQPTDKTKRTTPVTSTPKKTATPKKTVPATTEPAPVAAPETTLVTEMKKKDLIAKVTEASGVKRSEAKKVIEATLKELGDALQREEELNLPPLGKMSVNRVREATGAHIVIAKLRRPKAMLESSVKDDVSSEEGDDDAA